MLSGINSGPFGYLHFFYTASEIYEISTFLNPFFGPNLMIFFFCWVHKLTPIYSESLLTGPYEYSRTILTWWNIDAAKWDADVLKRFEHLAKGRPHLPLEAEAEEGVDHKAVGGVDEGGGGQVRQKGDV